MKLYIAEKPSLGRAIAEVLPKPHHKEDGFIRAGNGDCVSWCVGHLLEAAEPQDYDPSLRQWRFEQLPIVPQHWQLRPKATATKQLSVLKKLLQQATHIIHAGDPDREGQLLVDEVIHYLGVKGEKLAHIQRLLINDLNPAAVQQALNKLQPNQNFAALSTSALARSRADWLYGINLTRAYSLQGQKSGFNGVLSVGRVQTPVLGLVVRRDAEIESFVSQAYFEVRAHIQPPEQPEVCILAKWQPSEACAAYCDTEGRVLSEALARNVVARITQQPALLSTVISQRKRLAPPLPYSLSALQIDAANQLGLSAQAVLDTCQTLYEQHKLITYPRSDCRYLPLEHWQQASSVVKALTQNLPALSNSLANADLSRKSKCWNPAKVEAHHAIIPTQKTLDLSRLSAQESGIYRLIARQYLAQFFADYAYQHTRLEFTIAGGLFVAQGQEPLELGWKHLYPKTMAPSEETEPSQLLPKLTQGTQCWCPKGELLNKHTQPPKPFNDATLMAAMTGINRFVRDTELKKILKDTDGIGTEATRASIVELLFKRGFLQRDGKTIRATANGKALINALPDVATTPDMTANWELALAAIHHKNLTYGAFMEPLTAQLHTLVAQSQFTRLVLVQTAASRGARKPTSRTALSTTKVASKATKTPPKGRKRPQAKTGSN